MYCENMKKVAALSLSYAKDILLALLERGRIPMSYLRDVVISYQTITKLIEAFKNEGLVTVTEVKEPRRVLYVELTQKGKQVALHLKDAEAVIKGEVSQALERWKHWRALVHFNVYDDHITIIDASHEQTRYINVYFKSIGGNKYKLWCELCQSDQCEHVDYAWSLKVVREKVLR